MTHTATCPKCNGTGHLSPFAHVANGTCFECCGAGVVEVDEATATAIAASVKRTKTINLPGFGEATIARDAVGFTATVERGQVWFSIDGGRVTVDTVSDSLARRAADIRAALQSACRVAA